MTDLEKEKAEREIFLQTLKIGSEFAWNDRCFYHYITAIDRIDGETPKFWRSGNIMFSKATGEIRGTRNGIADYVRPVTDRDRRDVAFRALKIRIKNSFNAASNLSAKADFDDLTELLTALNTFIDKTEKKEKSNENR